MEVLVTGATGFIGSALVRSLVDAGHRPIVATRGRDVPAGVDGIAWDPDRGTIDRPAIEGIDAVVHLAGAGIADRRWTDGRKQLILDSRTRGTDLLVSTLVALDRKPTVLVSGSAVGYYGDRGDQVLTEQSPPGADFAARVCARWEAAAEPARGAGIRVVTIRTGIVLGVHGGMLGRIGLPFRLGLGGRIGSGRQYVSWIALEDEVAAIRYALEHQSLQGSTNLTAPNPVTNAELTAALGRVLHRPTLVPTPVPALRALYGSELVDTLLLGGQRVLPAALETAGFPFSRPTLEGALHAILDPSPSS
jgi:uncharacterized protein (TIGR01777 family)